ncbi:MAG TPA: arginyltransferase [Polyangiaceae bacterium]|nr:arginyltransferase [Polyangiaceae bacterium]
MEPRWTDHEPQELVVHDAPHVCPYLPARRARLPMRLPARALSAGELDARLAEGDRRHGTFLYRPSCGDCAACEAIRIPVDELPARRSHRRVLRRGDRLFRLELGSPTVDSARLALYQKHKEGRGLTTPNSAGLDARAYEGFLVQSCVPAFEMRYWDGSRLAAIAVVDRGLNALSAVYCYWDPEYERTSLGTYSILKQIELCRRMGVRYLYLGLYIADNPHMNYKAGFRPHERLVRGDWVRFD